MTTPSLPAITRRRSTRHRGRGLAALVVAALAGALLPALAVAAPAGAAPADPANPWTKVGGNPATARAARPADIDTTRFAGFTLDRASMSAQLARAPREQVSVARVAPLVVSLPTPEGDFQRFELTDSPVMEAKLAAQHPEIKTYVGKGLDDPTATVRADLTPLGFHASVRAQRGVWFVDPYYHLDQSLYASYYGHDVSTPQRPFIEQEDLDAAAPDGQAAEPGPAVRLRTYRLALVTDPSYANYFGAENVTAAKVTLINRVTQVYEDETAIRLVLVNDTDKTNLNTTALASEPNGPCGAAACFTPAQLATCGSGTLTRNQIVLGQLVGAGNYDVGHIGLGVNGGGVAGLGVVGGSSKARGCTGLPTPVGDFYAVDYVAHEIGHQFGGNHTFNGTQLNCSGGNRSAANSYEPGSGSSIMAYAGICQQDNLQPHSDPYWSQRSYTEITTYVSSNRPAINEVQNVSLRDFDANGDSFTLNYAGHESAPITRGANYTTAGIKAAIEAIEGWPAGATVVVAGFGGAALDDTGFQVTFSGGPVATTNVDALALTDATGVTGFVGETNQGGPIGNGGYAVEETDNHPPVVTVPKSYAIPLRTPFSLTGSATDPDGDTVTYLWEQNDRGGLAGGSTAGTALVNNTKVSGPLFRQFGTAAIVSPSDTLEYYSPGENAVTTNPTRVFPDLAQIAANNTNAVTGGCPAAPPAPTVVPAELVDCYSEFLPTADWVGFDNDRTMHFRLTARDGHPGGGGVGSADTALVLAPTAGPFLVTSPADADLAVPGGSALPVTWDVAGTNVAPIGVTEVKISLSVDNGATFPYVLAERTANDGTETVTLPGVATGKPQARIKIEAVGNVFFDVSDRGFQIQAGPRVSTDVPAGGATVQYSDALAPEVHVTAVDQDGPGTGLTATATGLPSGLLLSRKTSDENTLPGTATFGIVGNTKAAPGDYPVTVTVTDSDGLTSGAAFLIKVAPENAEVAYTGDTVVYGRGGATALLQATLRENWQAEGWPGDIRTATVTFAERGRTLCVGAVGLLGGDSTEASASCSAALSLGTHDVTVTVGGNYTGTASARVEIARPQTHAVLGGGALTTTRSAGSHPADPGSRTDVALVLASSPVGAGGTGLASVKFTSGDRRYEIRSTGIDSIGVRAASGANNLDVRGRATLVDVTDARHPVSVATGLTLRLTATDRGLLGTRDTLGVTLTNGSELLFSSDWTGTKTQELRLSSGTLLIL